MTKVLCYFEVGSVSSGYSIRWIRSYVMSKFSILV